jgi:hypothetical protein
VGDPRSQRLRAGDCQHARRPAGRIRLGQHNRHRHRRNSPQRF